MPTGSQVAGVYTTSDLWLTGALSVGLILLTVLFHYEALRLFTRFLEVPGRLPRIRILYLVFGLFVLHALEIVIFAGAYLGLHTIDLGELKGL